MHSLSIPRIRLVLPAILAAIAAFAIASPAVASAASFSLAIHIEPGEEAGTVECEVNEGPVEPCEPEYEAGDQVNLVPGAEEGYEFLEFSGDCGPLACELEMDSNKEVTATFEGEAGVFYGLDLEIEGEGKVLCEANGGPAEACEAEYEAGTELVLTPEAEEGSEFLTWDGDCLFQAEECELTMDEAHSVTAIFEALPPAAFPLEINVEGEGSVECEAQEGPEECQEEYPAGTEVALLPVEEGGEFLEWEGACSGTEGCVVTMDEGHFVEAIFSGASPPEYELEVNVTGEGEVSANEPPEPVLGGISGCGEFGGECQATYIEGDEVVLVATPEAGWETTGWSGCAELNQNECKVTMTANKSVSVEFEEEEPNEYELEVNVTGEGEVSANEPPEPVLGGISGCGEFGGECQATYIEGDEVVLVATPEAGWETTGWSGCAELNQNECKVTMTANKSVGVTFAEEGSPPPTEYTLAINKNGTGSGSVSCDGGACAAKYTEGTSVTLAASPASGSTFAGWSGGGCSGTGGCVVTINSDTTVTATFDAESTPPPPPPVEAGTARVANKATVKSGKALLKVSCSGGPCKGQLKLVAKVKQGKKKKNLTIGKASFSLASGATKTIKVKLSGPAKQELAKGRTVKAKVKGSGVASSTVKLKNAKTKKKSKRHRRPS